MCSTTRTGEPLPTTAISSAHGPRALCPTVAVSSAHGPRVPHPTTAISSAHGPRALCPTTSINSAPWSQGPLQGVALLLESPRSFLALQGLPTYGTGLAPCFQSSWVFFFLVFLLHNFRGDLHKTIQLPSPVHMVPYLMTSILDGVSLAFLAPSVNTLLSRSLSAEGNNFLVSLSLDLATGVLKSQEESSR